MRRRALLVWIVSLLLVGRAQAQLQSPCETHVAKLLRADAKRATQWNWGWGSLFAMSALAHTGLAVSVDNRDLKVSLWTGAVKSTLGTFNQVLFPIRIEPPAGCEGLAKQLTRARRIEQRRHNWFAHASVLGVNMLGFAAVAILTEDYLLAASGSILGSLVGELVLYTSPNRLREAGFQLEQLGMAPLLGAESFGFAVHGRF